MIGMYKEEKSTFEQFIPESFTTPTCAAAARVYAPIQEDYADNPWLTVVLYSMVSTLHHDNDMMNCGGVLQ